MIVTIAQNKKRWRALVKAVVIILVPAIARKLLTSWVNSSCSRGILVRGVN